MAATIVLLGSTSLSLDSNIYIAREKGGQYRGLYNITAGRKESTDKNAECTARREVSEELGPGFAKNKFIFLFYHNGTPVFLTRAPKTAKFVPNGETDQPRIVKLSAFLNGSKTKVSSVDGRLLNISKFLYDVINKLIRK